MAEEELGVLQLENNFYRDGFGKVIFLIVSAVIALGLLVALSVYFHVTKPPPINFVTEAEWRVLPPVPIDQPYVSTPDLLQWAGQTISRVFVLDFLKYDDEMASYESYFTANGWGVFQNQANNYVSGNLIKTSKLFAHATMTSAPYVINQGVLAGRYAWWVQVPITIDFEGLKDSPSQDLTLQILIVRIPTLNNLAGVAIDNMTVLKDQGISSATGGGTST